MITANTLLALAKLAQETSPQTPSWLTTPIPPPQNPDRIAQEAFHQLLTHQRPNGSVTGIGWWQLANAYTAIALWNLSSDHGSRAWYDLLSRAIRQCERRQRGLINAFNDDSCWWALLCVHMYSFSGEGWFLTQAEGVWRAIRDDGSVCRNGEVLFKGEDMEGGVFWKRRRSGNGCVNAISTGLYAELSVRLALVEMKRAREGEGEREMVGREYRPRKGMVLDHIDLNKDKRVDWTFTYNTAVALGTCALLFEATREEEYMILACHMARRSMNRPGWVEDNGVLTEKGAYGKGNHDPLKDNDSVGFKSVLIRQLGTLYDVLERTGCPNSEAQDVKDMIRKFVYINFQSQVERNTDGRGRYGPWWNGPFECPTSHSQMAVLDVFAAAQTVKLVGVSEP
ncbi:uncharacterized protein LTR77_007196 [Saxophila tyrrhenica]|uniref:Uncharacterized protein n=1 Tax=Saxophila tyrrhenica TaxID=1690608 RepID=A0AAV9P6Z4_9PEZI|nr:hypothetical protein LTR77_007196 [Saxophila tyrrhenica]